MIDLAAASFAWVRHPRYIDLTSRQIALLSLLCDTQGPHHVGELAERMGVSKPVITRAANCLQGLGFLMRSAVPTDKRRCVLHATRKGATLRQAMKEMGR